MRANRATVLIGLGSLLLAASLAFAAEPASQPASTDWPQFRGPNRDGVAASSPKLLDAWPTSGPDLLWRSEWTEGRFGREAGCSSPVVADGKVFVYVNLKVPKDGGKKFKPFTAEALTDAGWLADLPDELARKIEAARVAYPDAKKNPPGAPIWFAVGPPKEAETDAFLEKTPALDKYIKDFIATLDPKDAAKYSGYIKRRLTMFYSPFTWDQLVTLSKNQDAGAESVWGAMRGGGSPALGPIFAWEGPGNDNWQHGGFGLNAVLRASKITDTIACLDAGTGKTIWKKDFPVDVMIFNREGMSWSPHGGFDYLGVSAVPAVAGDKVYVVGAMGLYCLSAKDGSLLWQVPGEPEHASPLVADGVVYHCGAAYNAEDGKLLWRNPNYKPNKKPWYQTHQRFASAQLWTCGGAKYIIANDAQRLCALDLKTGAVAWTVENSKCPLGTVTPVICGDVLLTSSGEGLQASRLTPAGLEMIWKNKNVGSYGPLIYQGHVYCFTGAKDHGVEWKCLDFKTGEEVWAKRLHFSDRNPPEADTIFLYGGSGDVTSTAALADGKIIELWGSGHFSGDGYRLVQMLKASPEGYVPVGQANFSLKIAGMSSPAVANGRLFFRLQDGGVACYDLCAK